MVLIFKKEGKIAIATLNEPEKLNPLSPEICNELVRCIEDVRNDAKIRCLIITGSGKGFSSGADVKLRLAQREAGKEMNSAGRLMERRKGINPPYRIIPSLRQLEKPVIAAINGVAAAAGLSLALACDFRIASEDARFVTTFVKRGLVPASGQSYLLPWIVGFPKALELILTSDTIDAAEALRIGLVNQVVPRDDLMKEALALANRLAAMPPLAMGFTKQLAYKALEKDMLTQIDYEMQMMAICRDTNDHRESDRAFLEKRDATYKGE